MCLQTICSRSRFQFGVVLAQSFIHAVSGVPTHRGHPIRVEVGSKRYAGVPGEVLDIRRLRTTRKQDREAAVAKVTPAYFRQPHTLEQGLEELVYDVLGIEVSSFARSENEPGVL